MAEPATQLENLDERRAAIEDKRRIGNAVSWAAAWVDEHDLEIIAFSRAIGLGDSGRTLVSKFLSGKLETDPTTVVLAIEQFRASVEGPEGISAVIGFRETKSARMVWQAANSAREGHKMAAVVGYTGFGKTEAMRQFQRQTQHDRKPPVRIITCNVLVNAPFMAKKLALELGVVEKGGEPAMCLDLVMKRLRSHPEFWIVDEANFLHERCLEVLRNIYDVTATGMLLAGTPTFLGMVNNRQHAPGAAAGGGSPDGPLALFADRIFTTYLPGLADDEVIDIAEDVLKAELADQAIQRLIVYVNHNMRRLTRMLLELREIRKKSGARKIDEKMIDVAWAKLQHVSK